MPPEQDFLRLLHSIWRGTQYPHLSGVYWYARFSSGIKQKGVEFALRAGLATNCSINQYCKFDRKNYFYPDNPQNYQISQLYLPICHDGFVEIETEAGKKKVRIHEMHMEEDAGKLIHDEWEDCSLVDYNRSGVPLIEIVSEPDMRSADEVIAYLEKLRCIMQYLDVSDCKLQEGSMRADVNLSVRVGRKRYTWNQNRDEEPELF